MRTTDERPQRIKDMIGQDVLLSEMKKRSIDNSFESHMIFVGKSGSGKSTLALNLAKLINCKNPIIQEDGSREPCNECYSCMDVINQVYHRDVYYMDATYMGKDEVQKLHEKIATRPMHDKNKVFIIDEAHLLNSKEARGGMLTIAEKKTHGIYFILCTTDISKFDDAFKSRFARYKFHKVKEEDMESYLQEKVREDIDSNGGMSEDFLNTILFDIIPLIVYNAEGSVRQALQYIDRALILKDIEELTNPKDIIIKELGLVSEEQIFKMINSLLSGDIKEFFKLFNYFDDKGYIFNYLTRVIINDKRFLIGDGSHLKGGVKDMVTRMYRESPVQFNTLFNTFGELLQQNTFRFNERYFEYTILKYFEQIKKMDTNPIPVLNESESSVRKRKRRPVQ